MYWQGSKKACRQSVTRPALCIPDCCYTNSVTSGKEDTKNADFVPDVTNMKFV